MALTVTAAYTVLGFSGFGAILVALPVLAHLLSLRVAVPVLLVCDLFAASLMGLKSRHAVDRGELLRLAPFLLAGMALGVVLLSRASEAVLLTALGGFVLAMSLWNLYGRVGTNTVSATWALPASLLGGTRAARDLDVARGQWRQRAVARPCGLGTLTKSRLAVVGSCRATPCGNAGG